MLALNKNLEVFMEVADKNSVVMLNDYSEFSPSPNHVEPESSMLIDTGLFSSHSEKKFSKKELIAAGRILHADMVDRLTAQAYYNPQIITLTNLLLSSDGESGMGRDFVTKAVFKQLGIRKNALIQVEVPEAFVHKTYRELFLHFAVQDNMIALGLYR